MKVKSKILMQQQMQRVTIPRNVTARIHAIKDDVATLECVARFINAITVERATIAIETPATVDTVKAPAMDTIVAGEETNVAGTVVAVILATPATTMPESVVLQAAVVAPILALASVVTNMTAVAIV